jgi:hypothetical protein
MSETKTIANNYWISELKGNNNEKHSFSFDHYHWIFGYSIVILKSKDIS